MIWVGFYLFCDYRGYVELNDGYKGLGVGGRL